MAERFFGSRSVASRAHIVVRGTVQGVGFRPHVYRLAQAHQLGGWVVNTTEGVVVDAEGDEDELARFVVEVRSQAPPLAVVEEVELTYLPLAGQRTFAIRASQSQDGQFVPISPDVATCDDCRRELFDPADRRHRYPFINCTNCGPRFTIVEDIPYDRPRTTMRVFAMCPDCAREYHDPTDRRFHAQPNACPRCGPRLWLVDREGRPAPPEDTSPSPPYGAIRRAARLLADGAIVAVRGVGGFHLACDATNPAAVATLRERKRRVDKPFAIMSPDLETVESYCLVGDAERQLLESPARPIVLLRRREEPDPPAPPSPVGKGGEAVPTPPSRTGQGDGGSGPALTPRSAPLSRSPGEGSGVRDGSSPIAPEVAPANRNLGVMLPYSPLHHLLLDEFRRLRPAPTALVLTSGNVSEEPLAVGNAEALERLRDLADYFLLHDREIHTRCDDSVARVFRGRPTLLRRSRGYAPAPVRLKRHLGAVLACGAELKNTFCLTRDNYAFLSQHVGDMENLETYESFQSAVEHFERLFRIEPEAVAYDLHPDYLSTHYAQERLAASGGRLRGVAVQHHHAHVASCMVENLLEGPVIGVAFDGTGYGADGAVWGGELLVGDYAGFRRAGHLAYVPLPGGDLAIRRPIRMALSYLRTAFGEEGFDLPLPALRRAPADEVRAVRRQLAAGLNSPPTSSVGRLFDGVAALLGVREAVNYEGQAAIELEMLADEGVEEAYEWLPALEGEALVFDSAPLIREVVADHLAGVPRPTVAARFHNAVAAMVVAACAELRARTGLGRVCLSGGVFQNGYLLGRALDGLEAAGFEVYTHRLVPPNDGGVALGQAAIASCQLSAWR